MKFTTMNAPATSVLSAWDVCVVRVTAPSHSIAQGTSVSAAGYVAAMGAARVLAQRDRTFLGDAAVNGNPGIRSWSPPV